MSQISNQADCFQPLSRLGMFFCDVVSPIFYPNHLIGNDFIVFLLLHLTSTIYPIVCKRY